MLQGFGLGFMFVPLNTIALSTVPAALRTQGTSMWTLIRNLGSSIGVSIVIANLTNKTIMMHAHLAESLTPFNQAMTDPAAAMLDPTTDTGRALLENLITQQATIIAYANDFKLMMIVTLMAFPLILLIRPAGATTPSRDEPCRVRYKAFTMRAAPAISVRRGLDAKGVSVRPCLKSIAAREIDDVVERLASAVGRNLAQSVVDDGCGRALGRIVRRDDDARVRPQWTRMRQRLGLEHVERSGIELASLQAFQDFGVDLEAAAAGIDQHRAR